MSSYITASNQEMLWRTIKKNSLFDQVLTQEQQPIWFREIIGNFYSENANKNPSNKELLELNKSTLRFMIHKLKERIVREPVLNEPINDRLEPKSISYQSNYDSLQNDYNNMHKRNIPQEPDFKEPLDNEKIQNMEELLQQQLKDRALEMPKPPIQLASKSVNPVLAQAEIKDMSVQTENIDVDELKNQIETLLHRTDALEREINVMRTQLTKPTIIHQSNNEETLSL
jgi:regulator of replication initiation timing